MTPQARLLALDAALGACEGLVPNELTRELNQHLEKEIEKMGLGVFSEFLDAQRDAVQELAANPAVFGY